MNSKLTATTNMTSLTALWLASYLNIQIVYQLTPLCIANGWSGCYYPGEERVLVKKGLSPYWTNRVIFHELGHACLSKLKNDMSEASAEDFANALTDGEIVHNNEYYDNLIRDCKIKF